MKQIIAWLALVLTWGTNTANATLIPLAGGMVYDTDRDITWLADANYAKTSGYTATLPHPNSSGAMDWNEATIWAANLVYGGYDDWRLPTTQEPDPSCDDPSPVGGVILYLGYGCTGSEMGHMFYVNLGGIKDENISDHHNDMNYDLFSNIGGMNYWSSTMAIDSNPGVDDWHYTFQFNLGPHVGYQIFHSDNNSFLAWAVRNGGGTTQVPLPNTIFLISIGLVVWRVFGQRRVRCGSLQPV